MADSKVLEILTKGPTLSRIFMGIVFAVICMVLAVWAFPGTLPAFALGLGLSLANPLALGLMLGLLAVFGVMLGLELLGLLERALQTGEKTKHTSPLSILIPAAIMGMTLSIFLAATTPGLLFFGTGLLSFLLIGLLGLVLSTLLAALIMGGLNRRLRVESKQTKSPPAFSPPEKKVTRTRQTLTKDKHWSEISAHLSEVNRHLAKDDEAVLEMGTAYGEGDCFFDANAQALESKGYVIPGDERTSGFKRLRLLCAQAPRETWLTEAIKADADVGGLLELSNYDHISYTQDEVDSKVVAKLSTSVWGRPHIEGRIFCQHFKVKLHIIEFEKYKGDGQKEFKIMPIHQLVTADGAKTVSLEDIDYTDSKILHIACYKGHYIPLKNVAKQLIPVGKLAPTENKKHDKKEDGSRDAEGDNWDDDQHSNTVEAYISNGQMEICRQSSDGSYLELKIIAEKLTLPPPVLEVKKDDIIYYRNDITGGISFEKENSGFPLPEKSKDDGSTGVILSAAEAKQPSDLPASGALIEHHPSPISHSPGKSPTLSPCSDEFSPQTPTRPV